jgi:hypothetical protein
MQLLAWGGRGHGTVGYIAEKYLTPEARKQCHHYLKHTLAFRGSWLDQVRYCEAYKHTRGWHGSYVEAQSGKFIPGKKNGAYNAERIIEQMKDGGYRSLPDTVVHDNISALIHIIGDMHCPMHNFYRGPGAERYSQRIKVDGKSKKRMIVHKGKEVYIHGFWDSGVENFFGRWSYEKFAEEHDHLSRRKHNAVIQGTPGEWVEENAEIAHFAFDAMPDGTVVEKMAPRDWERLKNMCSERIVVGGHRLAHVLNTIFGDATESNTNKKK